MSLESQLKAQTLVCDDLILVSLDSDCSDVEITPDLLLEGLNSSYDDCDYEVMIDNDGGYFDESNTGLGKCFAILGDGVGTYSVTISSGSNSCWGHIKAEDKLGPEVVDDPLNPDDGCGVTVALPFLCVEIDGFIPEPEFVDCSTVEVTYRDSFDGSDCSPSTVLTRTWILTDAEGNVTECVRRYTYEPFDPTSPPPTFPIDCPNQEIYLPCGSGSTPEDVYAHFYAYYLEEYPCGTSCDPDHPSYDEDFNAVYLANAHVFATRHAYPFIETGIDPVTGAPTILTMDGHICNTFTDYEDLVLPVCESIPGCEDSNNKVIRTWKVYNWCNPAAAPFQCTQIIKAADREGPEIDVKDFAVSVDPWGCDATIRFPAPKHLFDECSSFVDYYVSTGSGTGILPYNPDLGFYATGVTSGTHTFWYNAYDCCENTTSIPVTVSVLDATPPVAITKQDIVVSLIPNPSNPDEPGITKVRAESIDNGSFDGCGNIKLEVRRDTEACGIASNLTYNDDGHAQDDSLDVDDGKFIQFCCNDLVEYGVDENGDGIPEYAQIKVWLRVWDDGNGDGEFGTVGDNYSEVWSYVRLEDKSRPTILCPGHVTIDCEADPYDWPTMGTASGFNSCGEMGTYYKDVEVDLSNCNYGTIKRQWFITGYDEVSCIQNITKSGIRGAIDVTFPSDTLIYCSDEYDAEPYWDNAGPCDQMAYNVDRDTFLFSDGACYKILNRWTVINWCDYNPNDPLSEGIWSDVQVVKILDEEAPTLENCSETAVVAGDDCLGPVMLTNTAMDIGVCASNRLTWEVQVDLYDNWSIDYFFSSRVHPDSANYIAPTMSGEEVKLTLPEGVPGSMIDHRVVWKVTDGCGNTTTCTTYFTIVDNIPPTPYCVNLSTALMESGSVELWACDFDLGAFDNCTEQENLRFTFTDVAPEDDPNYNPMAKCSAREFTCDDIINPAGTLVTLSVYVWDEKGNSDFCTVFLTLVDNNGNCDDTGSRIAGNISTENGQSIESVRVELNSNQPLYPYDRMTGNDGAYSFGSNELSSDYSVSGSKNDDYLNGVSTVDLVIIQRHILGIEQITSPYKMIAADINNDSNINGLDLVELRKLILGIYTELPENDSWRFLDKSTPMDNNYPWPLNEIRLILDMTNDMMHEDFVGVKVGDVNESATANLSQPITGRNNNSVSLAFDDVEFAAGDEVVLALTSQQLDELYGMQFTLNTTGLELIDVASSTLEISESNYALLSENQITFSWNATTAKSGDQLFNIKFRATESGKLSNSLSLNSEITSAEAYLGDAFRTVPINLIGQNNSGQEFLLQQNNPNPFVGSTIISFNLPQATEATLTVSDVTGKTVWKKTQSYSKGLHNVEFNSKDLNVSGVLYYKLDAGSNSSTKKMIILK